MSNFNFEVESVYRGSRVLDKETIDEYVYHYVDVYVAFEKETLDFQTGVSFYDMNHIRPKNELEFFWTDNQDLAAIAVLHYGGADKIEVLNRDGTPFKIKFASGKELTVDQVIEFLKEAEKTAQIEYANQLQDRSDAPDDYEYDEEFRRWIEKRA